MEADLFDHRKEAEKKYNFDFEMEEPIEVDEEDESYVKGEVFSWEPCLIIRNLKEEQPF
jgi:hypothetical protein